MAAPIIFGAVAVAILILHVILTKFKGVPKQMCNSSNVLIVTAHPDDECMFFSPFILTLSAFTCGIYLTCLSSGNYYNKGLVRKKELIKSCDILGLRKKNISVIENSALPDNPSVQWNEDLIGSIVLEKIKKHDIDTVITFDDYGVSGHNNHIAISKAIRKLKSQKKLPPGTSAYSLESIPIWRKYIGVLDLPISYLSSNMVFISQWSDVWKSQKAMCAHWSQFVWFRIIYIAFSRYMIINTLIPIV
ncbi:N-acetylglucosaminyl-phosphatidylinositol de-N-acetylase-like [Saccoglossus kowalevskii]|uniref:N-acetylglucosaminylphosphatidylinositol deacetylase n=1 Tax=Saccoglossus kowalevskii TaxID=10224 RepID=A0ABM0GNX4_SACKO|nr:PREDICTED: N-acetylglucosaminyl-phosphatidylinositol de-N-acetylase-like [Saccoglossus kowalevskii]